MKVKFKKLYLLIFLFIMPTQVIAESAYFGFEPIIVTNIKDAGRLGYVRTQVEVTLEADYYELFEHYQLLFREVLLNELYLAENMRTLKGRQILQQRCTESLQVLSKKLLGVNVVEKVLFREFLTH